MRLNTTKRKLQQGKVVFGAIISENAPGLVEYCGAIGFDFVFLDGEHGSLEASDMENLVRAAETRPALRAQVTAGLPELSILDDAGTARASVNGGARQ